MLTSIQKNNINFTSIPLHSVKIPKVKEGSVIGTIDGFISKLDPLDEIDKKAVEQINKIWPSEEIKNNFCNSFKDASDIDLFYCVELIEKGKLSEKIIGLTKLFILELKDKKHCYLDHLVTKPEFKFNINTDNRQLKGIGEILFGKTFDDAKKNNALYLKFTSLNDAFYFKTFGKARIDVHYDKNPFNENDFSIPKEDFDKYINYWRKEYSVDSSSIQF